MSQTNKLQILMKKITVAIDGFSSCGKSTMAKNLAKSIGYNHIDSGAMYRAVTLYTLQQHLFTDDNTVDRQSLYKAIDRIDISFRLNTDNGQTETYLNGENVENHIRSLEVASKVSLIATIDFVRHALVAKQQLLGKKKEIVMDGRDIGTVVFPDAELKIFVTASAEIRAKRRLDEMLAEGRQATLEEVLKNVRERDHIDMTRKESPLRKAHDAIELDNTYMTIPEQQDWLLKKFEQAIAK